LRLIDPGQFAGTLYNFETPGDTLELVGQTVTGASITGTTLTVTRAAGAPLNFNLGMGEAQTSELYVSGPDVIVLPSRTLDWTGTVDGDFADAQNWNDVTDGLDPAVTAPGTLDAASITNGGTISGSGTVYQLDFEGTNTVAGALTAIGPATEDGGSLAVTGTLSASDGLTLYSAMSVSGTVTATDINLYETGALSAVAGGQIVSDGTLALSLSGLAAFGAPPPGVISVDSLSSIEIGNANTATPGAITVDATGNINGNGTLAAPVVNNGTIFAAGGNGFPGGSNTIEITGAVTGAGSLMIGSGFVDPFGGLSGSGAVLRLESSVASSQTVSFAAAGGTTTAPSLVFADPSAFAGVLSAFDDAGDTLELVGETVTAAAINGSVLTVSVAVGNPLTFNLQQTPVTTALTVSGDEVTVREQPRTLVWVGNNEFGIDPGAFASATNWNDPGDGLTPAATPPDALDLAEFTGSGGSITGTGTVADLLFAGSAQWQMSTGTTLQSVGTAGVTIGGGFTGSLELSGGAAIISQGATDIVSGSSVLAAGLTASGPGSTWNSDGQLMIGDQGVGALMIQAGGTVTAGAGVVIANSATADGSEVDLIGTGSGLTVSGLLDVGAGGSGALWIESGAVVSAATLDAATLASADAQIDLSGAGSELTVSGAATVADDGTGVMSVLNGASFTASSLTIGALADSSGALVVSGDGSLLSISGQLNVGTALGTGDLTVGPGAVVNASVVNLLGGVVLEGGVLDPTVYIENGGSTTGGFGTIASDFILLEGTILSNGSKTGKQTEVVQGTLVGGGTADINGSVSVNGPGILQIGTHDTIELTGAVLNAATTTFTDNLTPTGTYSVHNSVIDVVFQDTTGMLRLDDIAGFAGTVATWRAGDSFVVTGGTLSNLAVSNGNTLTVNDSGTGAGAGGIDTIVFGSTIDADGFSVVNGDTLVACFAEGTRVQTEDGMVAVEHLTVGDRVVTRETAASAHPPARCEPIVWIGERIVNCRAHPRPETVWPVRVRAGAFGENVPVRDLYLSPDHAVFVDNVLIPVKLLLNATTIAQVGNDRVRYFHVELPRHAIILAEGLTVESYLDTDARANFQRTGETIRLFPDFAPRPETALAWETRGAAGAFWTRSRDSEAKRGATRGVPTVPAQRVRLTAISATSIRPAYRARLTVKSATSAKIRRTGPSGNTASAPLAADAKPCARANVASIAPRSSISRSARSRSPSSCAPSSIARRQNARSVSSPA